MRFLVDECTGPGVAAWLGQRGQEVFSAYDQAKGSDDDALLQKAFSEDWVLITNDKDFGEMIYRERRPHRGVVFLRLSDERTASKIAVLQALLDNHAERLSGNFVVVTEDRVRFAAAPTP